MFHRRLVTAACVSLAAACACARAGEPCFRDDFSAKPLDAAWVVTYDPLPPALEVTRGLLVVKHSSSWYMPSRQMDISKFPSGVRLSADMFFYPRPGFEWEQTGAPYPLGFQDEQGGVGRTYARFALIDINGDRYTDAVEFQAKSGDANYKAFLPGYNPATDQEFHRFAIEWKPAEVAAYFDGKRFAQFSVKIDKPLWVVGRNEYVNVLLDNVTLSELKPGSGVPGDAPEVVSQRGPIARAAPDKIKYWYFEGLGYEAYRIEEMFQAGALTACEAWSQGIRPPLPPVDYDQLAAHDVAIIAGVDLASIGPGGKRLLRDYLRGGGGMLVLGGKVGYACGGWRGSELEQFLPIRLGNANNDLDRMSDGFLTPGESHWITQGLDLSRKPKAEYVNTISGAKEGAKVILKAGERPFLVVWERDGHRVACLLGTPYGAASENYFGWSEWPVLVKRTLLWLGHRE